MANRLDWRGDRVLAQVSRAIKDAIDETTKDAAEDAKDSHWWQSRSGNLESEIVTWPAQRTGGAQWTGKFGTTKGAGFYGLFLERRTPFLRPAADRNFPKLAKAIKRRIR